MISLKPRLWNNAYSGNPKHLNPNCLKKIPYETHAFLQDTVSDEQEMDISKKD